MYVRDVVYARNEDGKCDAEGHAADDEHGVHCTRHTGGGEAVQQVACGVDGRESRHQEDGTGDECVPHGRQAECRRDCPRSERCDKACNHGTGVRIERISCARAVGNKAHECSDGGNQCLEPAAAEEFARAARADGRAECDHPVGVAERPLADAVDCVLNRIQRRVAAQDAPCEFADGGEDGEVDSVLQTFAELGKGALPVADAEHERCVGDMRLDLLGGNPQMYRSATHIAHDACTVRPVLHECLSDVEQDFHFMVQHLVAVLRGVFDLFYFHDSPYDLPILRPLYHSPLFG